MMAGKVGIAPGTTTVNISHPGQTTLVGGQDPGVRVRAADGTLKGYFDARPTDFELSKYYGYTPVHRGWISAKVPGLSGPIVDEFLSVLKQLTVPAIGAAVGSFVLHGFGRGAATAGAAAGVAAAILVERRMGRFA
jgi:hypothetical protein